MYSAVAWVHASEPIRIEVVLSFESLSDLVKTVKQIDPLPINSIITNPVEKSNGSKSPILSVRTGIEYADKECSGNTYEMKLVDGKWVVESKRMWKKFIHTNDQNPSSRS